MDWQLIETAPKDGSVILVCEETEPGFWEIEQAWWSGKIELYRGSTLLHPTHWMPLPTPPEALREDAVGCTVKFREILFSLQPHEVVNDIFDYFGLALSTAPECKVREFCIQFPAGVLESMAAYKQSEPE